MTLVNLGDIWSVCFTEGEFDRHLQVCKYLGFAFDLDTGVGGFEFSVEGFDYFAFFISVELVPDHQGGFIG